MSTPLTLSLSDSDETRGRLWTWFVRLGIGRTRKMSYPGWIPEQQRQCSRAEQFLHGLLDRERPTGDRLQSEYVPLRRRGDSIQYLGERGWRDLCGVENLREFARS